MKVTPIKRSKHIEALSRDHHLGLLFCWKIRQGIKKNTDPETMRKYVCYFWDNHLQKHFSEEEDCLFLINDKKCIEAVRQHERLTILFNLITNPSSDLNYELLTELTNSLYAHIRFEERDLFPYLERAIGRYKLIRIGALLEHSHAMNFKDNYPDEFWI
jgi:hemerythrin-like domain-containing protein